jgi:hypothetical protein
MFCSAVRAGSRLNDWKTKPTWSRRNKVSARSDRPLSSVSPMRTEPDVTVSSPARQCISVDLPDPDGPMMAANAPVSKPTDTPSKAWTALGPCP